LSSVMRFGFQHSTELYPLSWLYCAFFEKRLFVLDWLFVFQDLKLCFTRLDLKLSPLRLHYLFLVQNFPFTNFQEWWNTAFSPYPFAYIDSSLKKKSAMLFCYPLPILYASPTSLSLIRAVGFSLSTLIPFFARAKVFCVHYLHGKLILDSHL